MNLFNIISDDYFKALTGRYKQIFADCLEIIYNSYRTELSYGIDKESLVMQITDYFDNNIDTSIQLEDEDEVLNDSRAKALAFLRKLRGYGWIESEFGSDGREKIVMPDHSVTMMQAMISVSEVKEMEYQSEVLQYFPCLQMKLSTTDRIRRSLNLYMTELLRYLLN